MDVDPEVETLLREGTNPQISSALTEGLDANATYEDGVPIIHLVAEEREDPTVLRWLLEAGASVNASDEMGGTALHAAACGGNVSAAGVLIDAGADPNLSDSEGMTPLALAIEDGGSAELVELLLGASADPDQDRGDGWTPLMLAAASNQHEVAHALLRAGAKPGITKGKGADCVDAEAIAKHHGHHALVELLANSRK